MIRLAELRSISLFDGLSDVQLAELLAAGTEVPFEPGDELLQEGGHAVFWCVVVDGAVRCEINVAASRGAEAFAAMAAV